MASKYPPREEIEKLFKNLETNNYAAVFGRVDPTVDWTVMGTHPLAGRYRTAQEFQKNTILRLSSVMKEPGMQVKVRNVIGGGDQEWAAVELVIHAECKNGLKFENTYSWNMRFDESGKIVEVRAYLDSWMVNEAIIQNECPVNRAPLPVLE